MKVSKYRVNWTHVELQVICPLANQVVAWSGGVCCVILKDVIAPWCITVFIKHHGSARTA